MIARLKKKPGPILISCYLFGSYFFTLFLFGPVDHPAFCEALAESWLLQETESSKEIRVAAEVVQGYVKKIGEKEGGGDELMMFDSLGPLGCIYTPSVLKYNISAWGGCVLLALVMAKLVTPVRLRACIRYLLYAFYKSWNVSASKNIYNISDSGI